MVAGQGSGCRIKLKEKIENGGECRCDNRIKCKETEGKNEISISCFKKLRRFENENENE